MKYGPSESNSRVSAACWQSRQRVAANKGRGKTRGVGRERGRSRAAAAGAGRRGVGIGCCTNFMTFIYAQVSNWSPTKWLRESAGGKERLCWLMSRGRWKKEGGGRWGQHPTLIS